MSIPLLSKRLSLAASMVREGAFVADIGTDHGYLPISLLRCGKVRGAVLTDINEGPLKRAERNVIAAGLRHKVDLRLTDGVRGLENMGITDIVICGMGGELIAEILSAAGGLRDRSLNLILQPMTRPEKLRAWLFENGFAIPEERYCTEAGKHYVCINARFTGSPTQYTPLDINFGNDITPDVDGARLE